MSVKIAGLMTLKIDNRPRGRLDRRLVTLNYDTQRYVLPPPLTERLSAARLPSSDGTHRRG